MKANMPDIKPYGAGNAQTSRRAIAFTCRIKIGKELRESRVSITFKKN
jgi:hypothetical protein